MRKKILMGSFLAIFLLLSVNLISPVVADSTKILDDLEKLTSSLVTDKDVIDLLKDEELQQTLDDINFESNDIDYEAIAQDFADKITTKDEFNRIVERYSTIIEPICEKVTKYKDKIKSSPENIFFKISKDSSGIKITKQTDDEVTGKCLLVSPENNVVVNELGLLPINFWSTVAKILEFLSKILFIPGQALTWFGVFIMILSLALNYLDVDIEKINYEYLFEIGMAIGMVGAVINSTLIGSLILSVIIAFFIELNSSSRTCEFNLYERLPKFREIINRFPLLKLLFLRASPTF